MELHPKIKNECSIQGCTNNATNVCSVPGCNNVVCSDHAHGWGNKVKCEECAD
jgi:hypothetical protein